MCCSRLPDNIELLRKIDLLSCKNVLRVHKESLRPLLTYLLYSDHIISLIETQWNAINFTRWAKVDDTVEFWSEVREYEDATGTNPFKELSDFAFSVLLLPYSNAEVERVFSVMNGVKSKLRNKMKTEMVNAVLIIRSGLNRHGKTCHTYELPDSVINIVGTMGSYSQPSTSTTSTTSIELETDEDFDFNLDY